MRIGELSSRTGISQRMLRYYEQEGLLQPKRTHAGYRTYSTQAERIACHVRNLSEAGIKLKSIRMLPPCLSDEDIYSPRFDCPEARTTFISSVRKTGSQAGGIDG
ncbi:MerR family transcriptional regulator [Vibrio sp. PP-XX7]